MGSLSVRMVNSVSRLGGCVITTLIARMGQMNLTATSQRWHVVGQSFCVTTETVSAWTCSAMVTMIAGIILTSLIRSVTDVRRILCPVQSSARMVFHAVLCVYHWLLDVTVLTSVLTNRMRRVALFALRIRSLAPQVRSVYQELGCVTKQMTAMMEVMKLTVITQKMM